MWILPCVSDVIIELWIQHGLAVLQVEFFCVIIPSADLQSEDCPHSWRYHLWRNSTRMGHKKKSTTTAECCYGTGSGSGSIISNVLQGCRATRLSQWTANYGTFVLNTLPSQDYSFPWWNFHSWERMVHGPFVPWTVRSRKLAMDERKLSIKM